MADDTNDAEGACARGRAQEAPGMEKDIGNAPTASPPAGATLACARCVLLFWACASAMALPRALTLPGLARPMGYEPPPDSPSLAAEQALERHFPGRSDTAAVPAVVLVRALAAPGESIRPNVLSHAVANFSLVVKHFVTSGRWAPFGLQASGWFLGVPLVGLKARDEHSRDWFVSTNGRSATLIYLLPSKATTTNVSAATVDEFVGELRDLCHAGTPANAEVLLTGSLVIDSELRQNDGGLEASLIRMDAFVVPFAALIFWLQVGDARLLLIPPLGLMVTLDVTFALLVPVLKAVKVSPDFIASTVAIATAFSLDYSLLLLMRFSEGRGCGVEERVRVLLTCTSHTILVSGALVIIALSTTWLLPAKNLSIGCAVGSLAVAVSMCVHLTLIPACLLAGGHRLLRHPAPSCGLEASCSRARSKVDRRAWLRLVSRIERRPARIVAVIVALCAPLAAPALSMRVVADSYMFVPQNLPSVRAAYLLEEDFPAGFMEPYTLTIKAPSGQLLNAAGYNAMLSLHEYLRSTQAVSYIISPYQWLNYSITWKLVQTVKNSYYNPLYFGRQKSYEQLLAVTTSGDAALAMVYTDFLPRGHRAAEWVLQVRDIVRHWERHNRGYSAWLSGGASKAIDVNLAMLDAMPLYLAVSIAGIALVVFLAFRSCVLPLRLSLALILSIGVTWGIAVLSFQTSLLHPIFPSLRHVGGIEGSVVPIATGVAVALGLDYDVFLVSRIAEYRQRGLSDSGAVARGVSRTGGAISGAGAIMALAFSGLFTTEKPLLHQYATVLVVSVLLDAFVVRTVLVPALMLSAGDWNWWPRAMPEPAPSLCDVEASSSGEEDAGHETHAICRQSSSPERAGGPAASVVGRGDHSAGLQEAE